MLHAEPEVESANGRSSRAAVDTGEVPAEEGGESAEPAQLPANRSKHWYIIHTYSGFEAEGGGFASKPRSQAFGFADQIGQILIPTEEVVELRNGKKVTSKRLLYPGYVLVEMEMNDELWHAVKNTPRVTGFVGGGNTPVPLTPDEVNSVSLSSGHFGRAAAAQAELREERKRQASSTDRSPTSRARWTRSTRSATRCACWSRSSAARRRWNSISCR